MCCSVLQCIAVCCIVLQCVAIAIVISYGPFSCALTFYNFSRSVLQCVSVCCNVLQQRANKKFCRSLLQCAAVVAVCHSVLQCIPVCCSVLQQRADVWQVLKTETLNTQILTARTWKFSKVTSTLNRLYNMTTSLTFENFYLPARKTTHGRPLTREHSQKLPCYSIDSIQWLYCWLLRNFTRPHAKLPMANVSQVEILKSHLATQLTVCHDCSADFREILPVRTQSYPWLMFRRFCLLRSRSCVFLPSDTTLPAYLIFSHMSHGTQMNESCFACYELTLVHCCN